MTFDFFEQEGQKFPEILEKCKTAENATDKDLANIKANVKPKTIPMKCMGTCISEKLGWVSHYFFFLQIYLLFGSKISKTSSNLLAFCRIHYSKIIISMNNRLIVKMGDNGTIF